VGLRREINSQDIRIKTTLMTVAELADHFRQRELPDRNARTTYSTKRAYEGYLRKWIVPRWGQYPLPSIKAREVELWLANVERARNTRTKIRNMMSILFNHARRYDLYDNNPIQWVRQSAKRRTVPSVLNIEEVQRLLAALPPRERVLVLLDVGTGLRQSELFGLKWQDIDFELAELRVTRSIVQQVVGSCKTEASQKAIPLDEALTEALIDWRRQTPYKEAHHWIFASPDSGGKNPYWGQQLIRRHVRPVAEKLGITKRIGWHTFRHTYSTLLRSIGAELKVMQELLRHSTIRVTLDGYTQAVTAAKRAAQSAVMSLIVGNGDGKPVEAQTSAINSLG
jgi:integrase